MRQVYVMPLLERLTRKIETPRDADGCWEWRGYKDKPGYGTFNVGGYMRKAHRVSYETFVGAIPAGLHLDHLCRNHGCVRPDHLEPVTSRENTLRGETLAATQVVRTHCPAGHEYSGLNLYLSNEGRKRRCRACDRVAASVRRKRNP